MVNKRKDLIVIGIDPGQQGAIAIMRNGKSSSILFLDVPLLPTKGIDAEKFCSLINSHTDLNKEDVFCMIEKAQGMPHMGVVGVFNYGVGYGKLLSVLEILRIPFQEIHPMIWKKAYGILMRNEKGKPKITIAEKKKESLKKALQLFPSHKDKFYTPKGKILDGRVEALLICEYAKRIYLGEKIK